MPRRKPIGKLGPGGSLIVPAGSKASGLPRGVGGPKRKGAHLKTLRENARFGPMGALRGEELELARRVGPERFAETRQAYEEAAEAGNFDRLSRQSAGRMSRLANLHDAAVDSVEKDGVVIEEAMLGADGTPLSTRKKVNPAADFALKTAETLGLTAQEQLLTPAARGVSKKDEAVSRFLERQAMLRDSLKLNAVDAEVLPPGEPVTT